MIHKEVIKATISNIPVNIKNLHMQPESKES
jgi:hypothetical protein